MTTDNGIYVAVKPDAESVKKIREIQLKLHLNEPTLKSDLHVTLLYSRKVIDFNVEPDRVYKASSLKIVTWKVDDGYVVVLLLKSNDLLARHTEFINLGGTHDFPSYDIHCTLGYSVEDPNKNQFLSGYNFSFTSEYTEDLIDS